LLAGCSSDDDDTGKASTGGTGGSADSSSGGQGGGAGTSSGGQSGSGGSAGQTFDGGSDASTGGTAGSSGDAGTNAYILQAQATGTSTDGTESVSCTLTVYYQNLVPNASGGWTADQAGEAFRIITAGAQMYEFQALIGFSGTLEKTGVNVQLIMNDKPDPNAKPFWMELDVLDGTETAPNEYGGDWICAPLMLDEPGFKDMKTYAPGAWTLTPTTL
jgi:hypothetical protein